MSWMAIASSPQIAEVEIRVVTADDAAAYSMCRRQALERDPEAFSSSVEEHLKLSEEEIQRRLSGDPVNNFVFGVFANGKLMGTAGFVRERGPKLRHKGWIWGVYLDGELRGRGIGSKLLRCVVERAGRLEGLEQITLSVATTQAAAIALYRSLGFTSFGCEPKALKVGDRYIDEEYMILRLSTKADPSSG
jgi:ribosomal protein S18 acetylase RimI-like enzyme